MVFLNSAIADRLSSAMGIEAAEVLPYLGSVTTTFSIGIFRRCAMAWMIRRFAWCGMRKSISSGFTLLYARASCTTPSSASTAALKVSFPFILIKCMRLCMVSCDRRMLCPACRKIEEIPEGTVGVKMGGEDPVFAGMPLDHDGARSISEEDAGSPVLPVREAGKDLSAHQKDILIHP